VRFYVLVLLLMLVSTDAYGSRKVKQLQGLLDNGEYTEVLAKGQDLVQMPNDPYQADEKQPKDLHIIQQMVYYAGYMMASQSNTVAAYKTYLLRFPGTPYRDRVFEQVAFLNLTLLEMDKGTEGKAAKFLRTFPSSSLRPEAQFRLEEFAWRTTAETNTVEAYKGFAEKYSNSRYVSLANDKEAEIVYAKVRATDTIDANLDFLKKYPRSPYTTEVRERTVELAWIRAAKAHKPALYRQFYELFPNSKYTKLAKELDLELSWKEARLAHDVDKYRTFVLEFPWSDEAKKAERLEWDLYEYNRKPYAGELRPDITKVVRQEDGRYRLYLDVKDDKGNFVGGLSNDSFRVFDSGFRSTEVTVDGMEANRPVDVVFVLDLSGSMQDEITAVKEGIIRFSNLMEFRSRDLMLGSVTFVEEIFSVNGELPQKSAPLTASALEFQKWIEAAELESGSEEDDYWALDTASKTKLRRDSQRILILISDEGPTATRRFRSASTLANQLKRRDVIVYSVTPALQEYQIIADTTGGALFPIDSQPFQQIMEEIAQKISKQYKVTYLRPPNAPPVIDDLKVKLRISQEHALVLSNSPVVGRSGSSLIVTSPIASHSVFRLLADGGLLCSGDAGKSWNKCGSSLPVDAKVTQVIPDSKSKSVVWAVTENGQLWRSSDEGKNFSMVVSDSIVSATPWFGSEGGVLVTDGTSLKHVINDSPPTTRNSSLPFAGTHLLATRKTKSELVFALDSDGMLHISNDGGSTFDKTPKAGWPSDVMVEGFSFHPTRRGLAFANTQHQLFRTTDNGESWTETELPISSKGKKIELKQVLLDPSVRQLQIVTTSDGIFQSSDLGMVWQANNHITNEPERIASATVGPGGAFIFAHGSKDEVYTLSPITNREFVFSSVFFKSGSARPNDALLPHLVEASRFLRQNPDRILHIEGHTDSNGSKKQNMNLSKKRAEWVRDYLVKQGAPAKQLTTSWFGEERPLVTSKRSSAQAKNRRVEMVLTMPHSDLPPMTERK
jgi:outer membrane protein OmpA-like peptidoglycan-associated protein/uncharacterized protein YegL